MQTAKGFHPGKVCAWGGTINSNLQCKRDLCSMGVYATMILSNAAKQGGSGMFYFERCYDIDALVRRNMHIHTNFSRCAQQTMTLENIVREAERCGLVEIAITDHSDIWMYDHTVAQNEILKQQRDRIDTDVRIRIGAEISLYGIGKYSQTPEEMAAMEYRLFAQNHYHVEGWEQPEDRTPEGYARHTLACLEELFTTDYADCVAHPIVPVKLNRIRHPEQMLDYIRDNDLGDILEKGERAGCAWELHRGGVHFFPAFSRRYFNIGREVGAHFAFAADAHKLEDIDPSTVAEEYKKILL